MLLLLACARHAPVVITPTPVQPSPTAVQSSKVCKLPPVPDMPTIIGYPSAATIYVTVSDLEAVISTLAHLRAWLQAASLCLGATP
jgi:hypothetical protein